MDIQFLLWHIDYKPYNCLLVRRDADLSLEGECRQKWGLLSAQ